MPTSGTVGSTIFTNQQIIDHAFRRCKMVPQEIVDEHLETALDLLWLFTQTLNNKGIKLWNVIPLIEPIYPGVPTVPCPLGTEDTYTINLRNSNRVTGTASASEGTADNAFDGDLTTACTQVSAAGNITMDLGSDGATSIVIFGILPNASGSWDYVIEAATDSAFTSPVVYITRTAQTVVDQEWLWVDVQPPDLTTEFQFWRLRATGTTVLDVRELYYGNTPNEIPMYKLNRNDYANLPDKASRGRPTQFWYDKQRTQPEIELWPSPAAEHTFDQVTGFVQRQMQDVGVMTDELEVPDRWYLAIVCGLAAHLAREIKEVRAELIPIIDADAALYLKDAWDGEGDESETYLRPNISPYTR